MGFDINTAKPVGGFDINTAKPIAEEKPDPISKPQKEKPFEYDLENIGADVGEYDLTVPSDIASEASRTTGGMLGGMYGAFLAPETGGLSIPAGIMVGAAIGEGMEQTRKWLTGDKDKPKDIYDMAWKSGYGGILETAYDVSGQKVLQYTGKMLSPYKARMTEEATTAINYFKDKLKPVLLPAEATDSRVLDTLHNIAEASIFGGNKIADFKLNRAKFFDEYSDDIIDSYGQQVKPAQIGDLFLTAVEDQKKFWKTVTDPAYQTVDNMVSDVTTYTTDKFGSRVSRKGVFVDLGDMQGWSQKLINEVEDIQQNADLKKLGGYDLLETITGSKGEIPLSAALKLRTMLLNRKDEFSILNPKAEAVGRAKSLLKMLDTQIEKNLGEASPEALEAWRTANSLYKTGQESFNNAFIRRLIKMGNESGGTAVEDIAKTIFSKGSPTSVQNIKNALGPDTPAWNDMKNWFTRHMFNLSRDKKAGGIVKGQDLVALLSDNVEKGGFGDEMLDIIYTPEQKKTIKIFADTLALTEKRQGQGTGKMLIQLTQAGALLGIGGSITGLLASDYKKESAGGLGSSMALLLGPVAISRMMLNPKAVRLLTEGLKLPAGSEKMAGIMTRLAGMGYRSFEEIQDTKKKETPIFDEVNF